MKKLRLSSSLNLHACSTENIGEYIRRGLIFHKKAGFDAVDFPSVLFKQMGDDWKKYVEIALSDAREIGIQFELCHLPFTVKVDAPKEEADAFNQGVHRAIDAARALGVDYAVLHPNTATIPLDTFNRKAQYDRVMAHLSPFAEHAAKVGLNIVVENMRLVHGNLLVHRYCGTPEELCDIADTLGIGVCWDFGHANINGLKQSEALCYVGSRLKVLHVNDNFGGDDIHLPPFVGKIDWADAMQGLAAVKFEGLFNYEISVAGKPEGVREAFAKYLVDAAGELMKLM